MSKYRQFTFESAWKKLVSVQDESGLFGSQIGGFIDVDKQPVERNVSDGFLEEDVDDWGRAEVAQAAEHQQQFAEASRLSGIVSLCVSTERHLSLVLQARDSCGVRQLARFVAASSSLQRWYRHHITRQFRYRREV